MTIRMAWSFVFWLRHFGDNGILPRQKNSPFPRPVVGRFNEQFSSHDGYKINVCALLVAWVCTYN